MVVICYVVKFHWLVAFATSWFLLVLYLSDYKLLLIGQVKSDSFEVANPKLSYKYGRLRTNQIQASCYWHKSPFCFPPITHGIGSYPNSIPSLREIWPHKTNCTIYLSSKPYAFSFANNKGGWSESKDLDRSVDKIPATLLVTIQCFFPILHKLEQSCLATVLFSVSC